METKSTSRNTEYLKVVTQTLVAIQDGDEAKFRELWDADRSAEEWRGIADQAVLALINSRSFLNDIAGDVMNAFSMSDSVKPEGLHLDAHKFEEMMLAAGEISLRNTYGELLHLINKPVPTD